MRDQSGWTLDHALGQLLILKPDRDRRQRRVIPGLPIRKLFVVFPDQRGGLFDNLIHTARRGLVELSRVAQQRGGRQVVADP